MTFMFGEKETLTTFFLHSEPFGILQGQAVFMGLVSAMTPIKIFELEIIQIYILLLVNNFF